MKRRGKEEKEKMREEERLELFKELVEKSDSILLTDLAETLDLTRGGLMKRLIIWK